MSEALAPGLALDPRTATRGPHVETVDADRARRYADATNDPNPLYLDGTFAPPGFAVVPTWEPLIGLGQELVPPEYWLRLVHSAQDIVYHRPLVPGIELTTTARVHNVRSSRMGTNACLRGTALDADGLPVLDLYMTSFVRGLGPLENWGPDQPEHGFPRETRNAKLGTEVLRVDEDQSYRYADASGDHLPIHVDPEVARGAGFPGVILHGLCTLAFCSRVVLDLAGQSGPSALRRLAVRFTRPVIPGSELVVSVFEGTPTDDRRILHFEAVSRGRVVAKEGLAELN